jgi:ribosome-associated protein
MAKKALDIVILDMRIFPTVCDYFVIASGTSSTQVDAIAGHITDKLAVKKERLRHREGAREASWILLDYGDVVAHIFNDETRRFYDLERLWSDAPREKFNPLRRNTTALGRRISASGRGSTETRKRRTPPHAKKKRKS